MPRQIDIIHALRGVAILVVILFHAQGYALANFGGAVTSFPQPVGIMAVHVMFVISGFIIYWVYSKDLGKPERAVAFLKKRAAKTYPFYWAVLLPFYGALILFPALGRGDELGPWNLIVSFLLLPSDTDPGLYAAWFLKYDVAFYAVFALAIWSRPVGVVAGAAVCLAGLAYAPIGPYPLSIAAGVLIGVVVKRRAIPDITCPAPLIFFGRASYSLYLVHWPAIALAGLLVPAVPSSQILLAAWAVVAALAVHCLVERPMRGEPALIPSPRVFRPRPTHAID